MPRGLSALAATAGLLAALAAGAVHADPPQIADLLDRMRTGPGKCGGHPGLRAFARRAELDRAAASLASGASLESSVRGAGYPAVPVKSIVMSGSTDPGALETLLANHYCADIVDPGLAEIGIDQRGTRTTILLAAAFTPAKGLDEGALSARLLVLVNEARAQPRQCGSTPYPAAGAVRWNDTLARAARAHSEDMARNDYFAHSALDGTAPETRVERAGYDYKITGENIAAGQMTPEDAVAAWIKSPQHCANLMTAGYTEMGVAMAVSRDSSLGVYWTQVFGTPHDVRPSRTDRPARR